MSEIKFKIHLIIFKGIIMPVNTDFFFQKLHLSDTHNMFTIYKYVLIKKISYNQLINVL